MKIIELNGQLVDQEFPACKFVFSSLDGALGVMSLLDSSYNVNLISYIFRCFLGTLHTVNAGYTVLHTVNAGYTVLHTVNADRMKDVHVLFV
jgi:hypothetical protein